MLGDLGTALIGALIFGAAGVSGTLVAAAVVPTLQRFEDGPKPFEVHPAALVAGAAVLGAILGWRHVPTADFIVAALATICLTAIWYCDARTGIVPDFFTLIPLGALIVYGIVEHQPLMLVSAVVLFVPFALLAWYSKGVGMGWGDAKLAAFGGALLGIEMATVAFIAASFVAAAWTWLKYRQRNVPIAFAPYLVAAIAGGIALAAH
jgi:prepilin signal peptidase PulO-like enzyme (type II secretory pathway)